MVGKSAIRELKGQGFGSRPVLGMWKCVWNKGVPGSYYLMINEVNWLYTKN